MHHARFAGGAVEQSFQQRSVFVMDLLSTSSPVMPQDVLHPLPYFGVYELAVLSSVDRALVVDFSGVDDVREKSEQASFGEKFTSAFPTPPGCPLFCLPLAVFELPDDGNQRFAF